MPATHRLRGPLPRDGNRCLRFGDQLSCERDDVIARAPAIERIMSEVAAPCCRPLGSLFSKEVRRQQKHCRSWSSGGGCNEGLVEVVFNAVRLSDAAHPLCARLEQLDMVQFLEGVLVGLSALDVLDKCNERDAGFQGFGEGGTRSVAAGPF